MVYFKFSDGYQKWHLGEELPSRLKLLRVVVMQADGDELQIILDALKPSNKKGQS